MYSLRPLIVIWCVFVLGLPPAGAQVFSVSHRNGMSRITDPYRAKELAPLNLANSGRLEDLVRGGSLYLSLQDAIALALENNLDIELQRLGPAIAEASLLRAQAGGLLRGVPPSVTQGPTSGQVTGGAQRGQASGITQSAAQQASAAQSGAGAGTVISQTGTVVPNLDPVLTGFLRWGHFTNPQTNSFVTGNNTLINRNDITNFQFQQGFLTGTTVSLGLANSRLRSNSLRAELNPSNSSSLSLTLTQKLLQGYGRPVNNRLIRIAKNNREVSDLQFKQQVINTVSGVINLYWDLVSFIADVKVKERTVELNQKLLNDNRKQVEIGTLAPIEVVRAEAELANAQQDLTIAETRVLQQETVLKNALSRTGIASPTIADVRIVPTDRITIPETETVEPFQDLVANALKARPELAQRRIQIDSDKINLAGSRSQLLPQLDAVFAFSNNGLAGSISDLPLPEGSPPRFVPAYFVGGLGTTLGQVFRRNFPDYSAALQLNIPLRNRAAQADMAIDQLNIRQREIQLQQFENQVRVEVQNALIALRQSRATYKAAVQTRIFREQTLDAEQKKYALGASTIFNVILVQRDLALAQSAEVAALSEYGRARVQFDLATGNTLVTHNISIAEAERGQISRRPSPLPPAQ
jgi:outer membrane protein TolC